MAAELLKAGRVQTKSQNRRENAMTNAELNAMPSISSLMTTDELFEWPASRKKGSARHRHRILRTRPVEVLRCRPIRRARNVVGGFRCQGFVRTPESRGWIAAVDLPGDKYEAMMDKVAQHALTTARAVARFQGGNRDDPHGP